MQTLDQIYNPEIKEQFIKENNYEGGSANTVRYFFAKTGYIEHILKKDLFNFSLIEVEKALYNANPLNYDMGKQYVNWINKYLTWAVGEKAYRDNNDNVIKPYVNDKQWIKKFIDPNNRIHFTKDEILDMIKNESTQSKVLTMLIFDGVFGTQMSEIRNLMKKDINWEKKTVTISDRNGAEIKLSDETIEYLKILTESNIDRRRTEDGGIKDYVLVNNDYVMSPVISQKAKEDYNEPVSYPTLLTRFVSEVNDYDIKLTPVGLNRSGMIYQGYLMSKDSGILTKEQQRIIGENYNTSRYSAGKRAINLSHLRKWLNADNIEELYDIEVEVEA